MAKIKFSLIVLCLLLLTGCKEEEKLQPNPVRRNMTVVVYIAAENSLSRFYHSDLAEMESVADQIPLDCNFVVYVDSSTLPAIYLLNAQQGKVTYRTLNEEDSCNPTTFRKNIRDIVQEFPAEHYGLVMWSHGSGWIPPAKAPGKIAKTIGVDNNMNNETNYGSELEIPDMRKELEEIGVHWDYIFFDACFMQCVETAYELRSLTDYIIASPAEIPVLGAPYDKIMDCLTEKDTEWATHLPEKYYAYYKDNDGLVISTVKTSELDSLLQVTKRAFPDFYDKAAGFSSEGIQPYCAYSMSSAWKPEYFDMGSAMHQMLSPGDYEEWRAQMERTVITRLSTPRWGSVFSNYFSPTIVDEAHNALMSIFIPYPKYDANTKYNTTVRETLWYKDFTK